jgi:hypothetical protein
MDSKIFNFLSRNFPGKNSPSIIVHISYVMAAVVFCKLYEITIIAPHDFVYHEYSSIYKVLSGEALRSIQNRILVPYIFKFLSMILPLSDTKLFMIIIIPFTYLSLVFFRSILNVYFSNKTINSVAAILLLYPVIWNLILMNTILFFVDQAIVLFMTAGMYFIITKKNYWLLAVILISTFNHVSTGFLILAFVLFNYRSIFTKKTFMFTVIQSVIFLGCFAVLKMIYTDIPPERDDNFFALFPESPFESIIDLPRGILIRDIFLNYGGLHILALLVLITGLWKQVKTEYLMIFLLFIPYVLMAILRIGVRIEEMRNWIPIVPFVTVIALIFFTGFRNSLFSLSHTVMRDRENKKHEGK